MVTVQSNETQHVFWGISKHVLSTARLLRLKRGRWYARQFEFRKMGENVEDPGKVDCHTWFGNSIGES